METTSVINDLPNGYWILWPPDKEFPEMWLPVTHAKIWGAATMFVSDQIILEKVDNLTWIEHLAKKRGLVV